MFGKLLSKLQGESGNKHPLATDANVDEIVAGLPSGNPIHQLVDLAQWLDDVARFRSEVGLDALCRAVLRLDAGGRSACSTIVTGYLDPRSPYHGSESAWSQVGTHLRLLVAAYRLLLGEAIKATKDVPAKTDLALCAARALRALAQSKVLARFRYRTPDASWWQDAHRVLADASTLGVAGAAAVIDDETGLRRTPLQCYLVGLYLELAPLGNLVPQQIAALDAFLDFNVDLLELTSDRRAQSTHAIDLSGSSPPLRLGAEVPAGSSVRCCSVRRLQSQAARTTAQLRAADVLPVWVPAACTKDQITAMLAALIINWSDSPPQRTAARSARTGLLKVVHGLDIARRMVSYSAYARKGELPGYDGVDLNALFNESRFGRVRKIGESEDAPLPIVERTAMAPLAIVEHLETSGDRQMAENWQLIDESAGGIGALAPGLLSRHRIGGLVAFRRDDDIEWRLGIVRRIGRDAQNRPSIGLEAIVGPAVCAAVWPPGAAAGTPAIDAILPTAGGEEILLPADSYIENWEVDLVTNEGTRRIVLIGLPEAGSDFDRVRFRPAHQNGDSK